MPSVDLPSIPYSDGFYTFCYVFSILAALSTLRQIQMYFRIQGSAETIAIFTWFMYTASSVFWVIEGFMVDDFAIVISSGVGALLYGLVLWIGVRAARQDGRLLERAVNFYLQNRREVLGDSLPFL
jgi:uncharacterized protein with PQ loop repeat